ncbi:MAG TPA: hypothetical protein VFA07_16255 [Chthonomonadaceae bacterium]|nr:hypothetical protein [Chthonomonadaceae bacterium]
MKRAHRMTTLALATTLGAGTLFAPIAARASEDGHRNTAIGLGAVAAGLLLTQKNKLPGLLAAGGAAYAYTQYQRDVHSRHQREDRYGYNYDNNRYNRDRYNNGDDGYYQDNNGYQYRNQGDNQDYEDYNDAPRPSRSYRYHRDNYDSRSYNHGRRHCR